MENRGGLAKCLKGDGQVLTKGFGRFLGTFGNGSKRVVNTAPDAVKETFVDRWKFTISLNGREDEPIGNDANEMAKHSNLVRESMELS